MHIEINKKEKKVLEEILISAINDIKDEIHHTDNYDFKEELRMKEKVLEDLLQKIQMID